MRATGSIMVLLAALLVPTWAAAQSRWQESWSAAPAAPQPESSEALKRNLAAPVFTNQTIVQVVRLTAGGARLRVRLTNEYGVKPLYIGSAAVALLGPDGKPTTASPNPLTFGGRQAVTIPPGAPMLSDPVALATTSLAKLRVAIYVPAAGQVCTCHMTGGEHIELSPAGDFTRQAFSSVSDAPGVYRAFLSGIEVSGGSSQGVVVAFGDSITDGFKSTIDADRRWPDTLAERLIAHSAARAPAVVDQAISGNRLLFDGYVEAFGQSGLSRFDRDVLSLPGVTHLIVLEGINDIGIARKSPPSAETLIAGYQQLIERAHAHGVKVIFGTLLPYRGAAYFETEGELVRQAVNRWIRKGAGFDGMIDFDAAMRDPADPSRLRGNLQSGDWLHPNDLGYRVMANAVDLALLN